jgi:hypothetical protein
MTFSLADTSELNIVVVLSFPTFLSHEIAVYRWVDASG